VAVKIDFHSAAHWIQRNTQLAQRAPQYVAWALALAIAGELIIEVRALSRESMATLPAPSKVSRETPHGTLNFAAISNSHLFGVKPVEPRVVAAQNTARALVLTGVLASEDPSHGRAILGESTGSTRLYVVSDTVPGGARLHAVLRDRVLLEHDGVLETLLLPQKRLATLSPVSVVQTEDVPERASTSTSAKQSPLQAMRKAIEFEHPPVDKLIRPLAAYAGGVRGFQVYPAGSRAAFERLGLRPGDLVVAVNGTPVSDGERGAAVFSSLSSLPAAQFTVLRRGVQQEVVLNTARADADARLAAVDSGLTDGAE
jgi:general secretion pathway protein C